MLQQKLCSQRAVKSWWVAIGANVYNLELILVKYDDIQHYFITS